MVSVRPGYVFRDGWITQERAVVIRVRPDAKDPVDPAALAARLGVPVEIRDADPAESLATAWGLADTEAPHRYVSNYRRDLAGDFALAPVKVASILCHASPDAGWPTLRPFLEGVRDDLVVGIYDFTAPHILAGLEAALASAGAGKHLSLVLDPKESLGSGTKKDDKPEAEVIQRLGAVPGIAFEHGFVPMRGPRRPFDSAYHIKVAVADRDRFWLSSGNWQSSNQPALDLPFGPGQDPAALKTYNREWHAVVESPELATAFRAHIAQDLADALAFPPTEALDLPALPSFLVPLELLTVPDEELPARATYFEPFRATNVTVRPLLSPDNFAAETLGLHPAGAPQAPDPEPVVQAWPARDPGPLRRDPRRRARQAAPGPRRQDHLPQHRRRPRHAGAHPVLRLRHGPRPPTDQLPHQGHRRRRRGGPARQPQPHHRRRRLQPRRQPHRRGPGGGRLLRQPLRVRLGTHPLPPRLHRPPPRRTPRHRGAPRRRSRSAAMSGWT